MFGRQNRINWTTFIKNKKLVNNITCAFLDLARCNENCSLRYKSYVCCGNREDARAAEEMQQPFGNDTERIEWVFGKEETLLS